jgi:hypothetical protein
MGDSMRETKATARPWGIDNHAFGVTPKEFALRIYSDDPGTERDFTVGFVRDCDKSVREANADLIVTAVNAHEALVSALKDVLLWQEGRGDSTGPVVFGKARAALKLAGAE